MSNMDERLLNVLEKSQNMNSAFAELLLESHRELRRLEEERRQSDRHIIQKLRDNVISLKRRESAPTPTTSTPTRSTAETPLLDYGGYSGGLPLPVTSDTFFTGEYGGGAIQTTSSMQSAAPTLVSRLNSSTSPIITPIGSTLERLGLPVNKIRRKVRITPSTAPSAASTSTITSTVTSTVTDSSPAILPASFRTPTLMDSLVNISDED